MEQINRSDQIEQLQALYQLSVELSAQHSLDSVLQTALQHCLKLTDSQFGFVGLTTEQQEELDVVATVGFELAPDFYHNNRVIPLRPNIFSYVILNNEPIRTVDATADPRRVGQPTDHPPVYSFLGVPLRIQDRPIGMIGVANRPTPYQIEHEQLLTMYAAQVAIITRNAQLYEALAASNEKLEKAVTKRTAQLEQARLSLAEKASRLETLLAEAVTVQEHERKRIALEMHDGVNQLLYGAIFELKSADRRLQQQETAKAAASIHSAQSVLHQVEGELKRIIYDLRPPTLDTLGLIPTLHKLVEQHGQVTGASCIIKTLGEERRLPPAVEVNLYRAIQEALHNAGQHAEAQNILIMLAYSKRWLKVTISDDGLGFDVDAIQSDHKNQLGLLSMRERAESLGGRFLISSRAGSGTRIELSIPLDPSSPNRASKRT